MIEIRIRERETWNEWWVCFKKSTVRKFLIFLTKGTFFLCSTIYSVSKKRFMHAKIGKISPIPVYRSTGWTVNYTRQIHERMKVVLGIPSGQTTRINTLRFILFLKQQFIHKDVGNISLIPIISVFHNITMLDINYTQKVYYRRKDVMRIWSGQTERFDTKLAETLRHKNVVAFCFAKWFSDWTGMLSKCKTILYNVIKMLHDDNYPS